MRKTNAEYAREYQQRQRTKGHCCYCFRLVVPGRRACDYHLAKYRQYARDARARDKSKGVCFRSGCHAKGVKGGLCLPHYADWSAWRKLRQVRWLKQGLCTGCGRENLYRDKFRRCPRCRKQRQGWDGTPAHEYDKRRDDKMWASYLKYATPEMKRNKEAMDWIKSHQDLFIDVGDAAMSRAQQFFPNYNYEPMSLGHKRKVPIFTKEHE